MEEGDGLDPTAAFLSLPTGENEPREIAKRLVERCDQFTHLREGQALILFLMRAEPKIKAQRRILGTMHLLRFTGRLGPVAAWLLATFCAEPPDFVMELDATWWEQADAHQRTALVFHELKHAVHAVDKEDEPRFTEEGRPVWAIMGHDIEAFF
jgi:hypothetical protein